MIQPTYAAFGVKTYGTGTYSGGAHRAREGPFPDKHTNQDKHDTSAMPTQDSSDRTFELSISDAVGVLNQRAPTPGSKHFVLETSDTKNNLAVIFFKQQWIIFSKNIVAVVCTGPTEP